MNVTSVKEFTAQLSVFYHFTVRPSAASDWTGGGANERVTKSVYLTGCKPKIKSTFAVDVIIHLWQEKWFHLWWSQRATWVFT